MKNNISLAVVFIGVLSLIAGCGTVEVERVPVEKQIDLSGRWNDTDARMVSKEMITGCLQGRWLEKSTKEKNKKPVVIVGVVVNRSSEHIDPSVFIKSLEQSLIDSDKVTFVASRDERAAVREERKDQQEGLTESSTIKPMGKETGADFMLNGAINTVTDEVQGKAVTFYQVTLELINLTTNQMDWIGKSELKKYIRRSKVSP